MMMAELTLRLEDKYILKKVKGLENGEFRGSGAYGIVRTVSVGGTTCIAKRIHDILQDRRVSPAERDMVRLKFQRECAMLSQLRHPNIVHFVGVHYDRRGNVSLVMEALDSDLRGLLQRSEPDRHTKVGILLDVSFGLLHLHSQHPTPIIHRDLNPGNVLLTRTLREKIADLGVSSYLDMSKVQTLAPGAWDYMPPEALHEDPHYDTSLDVFSFGHITLCVGVHSAISIPIPPQMASKKSTRQSSIKRRKVYLNSMGQGHCLYQLAVDCLHDVPQKRPNARDLCDRLQWLSNGSTCNGRESKNTAAEGTTCSSGENKHESPSHDDSMFISSTEAEFDDGTSGVTSTNESEITQNDETVSSLQQKIAELMAEKEEIKEMVETYKAQAQVYRSDFEIERRDRVNAHDKMEEYKFQLGKLQEKFTDMDLQRQHQQAALHIFKAANTKLRDNLSSVPPVPSASHTHCEASRHLPPVSSRATTEPV